MLPSEATLNAPRRQKVCRGAAVEIPQDSDHASHKLSSLSRLPGAGAGTFPQFACKVDCFGLDPLGRLFAVSPQRLVGEKPYVLPLEPGIAEAHEIPDFLTVHCVQPIRDADP